MKKKIFYLVLVVLNSYIFFLIALFPMNLIVEKIRTKLPQNITLEQVEGSFYNGKARLVVQTIPIFLAWKLCPIQVLIGGCINGDISGITFDGILKVSKENIEVKNWNTYFSLVNLKTIRPNSPVAAFFENANFELFLEDLLLSHNGLPVSWKGTGKIQNMKLVMLDDVFTGDIEFAKDLSINIMLVSASTTINATIAKTDTRKIRIDAMIDTEKSELTMLLNSVCKKDASNRYKCFYETKF